MSLLDVPMTPDEYYEILEQLELNQIKMSRLLGVDARTVQRWTADKKRSRTAIPPTVARFLRYLAEANVSGDKAAKMILRRLNGLTKTKTQVLTRPDRPRRAAQITARDRDMRERYERGDTLDAIGRRWGITRERVRRRLLQCFGIPRQSAA